MKRIAILIPSLKPGGAEKQATLLATILDKHYEVDMFLLYGDSGASPHNLKMLADSNVHLHSLRGNIISKIGQLKKVLSQHETVVMFNYLTSCDVIGAIAGRLAGVKRIYGGIRNARLEQTKLYADKVIHNYLASGTIFNCYSGADFFSKNGYRKEKNRVIPNCFQDIADPIERSDKTIKHIVTVGRFVPQKDYQTLIKTIALLRSSRNDFVMDIVGYGVEERRIRDWVIQYGVADCVCIHIRPDDVQRIVRESDIYLSTSLFEGTSNSIMEAMNWSLPIVATRVGDNDRLVEDGVNGKLYPMGDAQGMSQALSLLLGGIKLRNEYGTASNRILRENYSMKLFEKRYLQLIEDKC